MPPVTRHYPVKKDDNARCLRACPVPSYWRSHGGQGATMPRQTSFGLGYGLLGLHKRRDEGHSTPDVLLWTSVFCGPGDRRLLRFLRFGRLIILLRFFRSPSLDRVLAKIHDQIADGLRRDCLQGKLEHGRPAGRFGPLELVGTDDRCPELTLL